MNNTISIRKNLQVQFDKLFHHNRQGSFKTRERYGDAFRRFIVFLADEFHLERLANISPKHIFAYTEYMVNKELSIATIKTELAAIRFFHDQIPNARSILPNNEKLELGNRRFGGVDRTWNDEEINRAICKSHELGRPEYAAIIILGRYTGLRIHECFRIDAAMASAALNNGSINIKGKGGLVRTVPLCATAQTVLKQMLERTGRGQKLFVPGDDQTHLAIHRLENFISYYRDIIKDVDSTRPLTFHGLRHTYAAEQYLLCIDDGFKPKEARLKVARLLGHGRDSVTRIYLASE